MSFKNKFKNFLIFLIFTSCTTLQYENKKINLYSEKYSEYDYIETAHFIINSPDILYAKEISNIVEKYYFDFMTETNLFSFIQDSPYRIIIHPDRETFIKKTKFPYSIHGFIKDKTIETYISTYTHCVLSHELTHLILKEYLGDNIDFHLWLNEGLATYFERKTCIEIDILYENIIISLPKEKLYPFSILFSYRTYPENSEDLKKFYAQSSSIVSFLIKTEGSFKFYLFLEEIKKGNLIENAIRNIYPASYPNLSIFERKWLETIGK